MQNLITKRSSDIFTKISKRGLHDGVLEQKIPFMTCHGCFLIFWEFPSSEQGSIVHEERNGFHYTCHIFGRITMNSWNLLYSHLLLCTNSKPRFNRFEKDVECNISSARRNLGNNRVHSAYCMACRTHWYLILTPVIHS